MRWNFKYQLIVACFFSACGETSEPVNLSAFVNKKVNLIILAESDYCWVCNRFFRDLDKMIREDTSIGYVWISREFKPVEKEKFDIASGQKWDNNNRHLQNNKLYRALKASRKSPNDILILVTGDEHYYYKGSSDWRSLTEKLKDIPR